MKRRAKVIRISGGPIVTMDADNPVVGEIVVCGGRITWAGRRGSAPASYGKAQTIDLKGQLLLPAFADAHTHFLVYAQSLEQVDLRNVRSLRSALTRVQRHVAADRRSSGWVIGIGFDINLWGGAWPSSRHLDRLLPDRPVVIWSHDQHAMWVNSEGLRRAGINHDTPDPDGGEIVRDAKGKPTGILLETACALVWDRIPKPSAHGAARLIDVAQREAHEAGVTAISDMGAPVTLAGFESLRSKGKLKLRLWKSVALADLDKAIALGLRSGFGDPWIKLGGVKIFLDGALGSQTAWLKKPYTGDRANCGICRLEPELFASAVRQTAAHGLSVCVHAIGDAAVELAVDVLLKNESRFPSHQPARIEHLQLAALDDIERLAGSNIIASMQPSHLLTDRDYADRHWGARARRAFAFRSLWDRGVTLAFGSDVPIERLSPLEGIGAAVHRARADDTRGSWYPQERLSVWEAVWGFTVGAALASGDGAIRGRIAPGYLADLTVLDRNIFSIAPRDICKTRVTQTIVDGELVLPE